MDLDNIVEKLGIKYVFVKSGDIVIKNEIAKQGILPEDVPPNTKYWVELSWGSGDSDEYDFAYNAFGATFTACVRECLEAFAKDASDNPINDNWHDNGPFRIASKLGVLSNIHEFIETLMGT